MKLILTQEVTGLGSPGDVVEVKDGYGRNYLVPRGVAIAWTKGGEKQVAAIRGARSAREVKSLEEAQQVRAALESTKVTLPAKAGANGRLFGTVTPADLAEALATVAGESLDKRTIVVTNPIKSLGAHQVSVKLTEGVAATVALNVIPA